MCKGGGKAMSVMGSFLKSEGAVAGVHIGLGVIGIDPSVTGFTKIQSLEAYTGVKVVYLNQNGEHSCVYSACVIVLPVAVFLKSCSLIFCIDTRFPPHRGS